MLRFVTGRLLESLVVLALISFLTYGLIGLMPGDPIDVMVSANPDLSPADAARLKKLYGLDQPILTRYARWAENALMGDFGYSRLHTKPVTEVLWSRLGNTVVLLGLSLILSLALAIPLGVIAAVKRYSPLDYGINLFCFAGISVPPFWLALMVIILFAVQLNWLPASGMGPPGGSLVERLPHLVLPLATLTVLSVGSFTRFMRAAMLQTLRQDYIRTAQAKGASPTRVVTSHALRNALIPLATVVALSFGGLFSGALITETMFAWLGMGKTIYDAILGSDYNLALVGLLLATGLTLFGNFLADIAYVALDPRVSFTGQESLR